MQPLPTIIRRARPLVTAISLIAWATVRLSTNQRNESFLRILIGFLSSTQDTILTWTWNQNLLFVVPVVRFWWTLAEDILAVFMLLGASRLIYCLYHFSWTEWKDMVMTFFYEWSRKNVPIVASELAKQSEKFRLDCDRMLHKDPGRVKVLTLPGRGVDPQNIYKELQLHSTRENHRWQEGTISGTVYMDDHKLIDLMNRVFSLYSVSNPLHPGYWPRLNQCEAEVVAMTSHMLHGPAFGSLTSGGTESIVLAIRAHLMYYGHLRGIRYPEIVCGSTAHAAVLKASEMFGIRLVAVDCSSRAAGYRLDPAQVRSRITSNTIMVFASAPCYPQGVVDPIEQLSEIAQGYDIGLHVDACLGGFILPFCKDAPAFDFRNAGVTSMSCDTHKYGYSCKGSSVVLYKTAELRHRQYFTYPHWTGGMYVTPTIAGSRSGALSVCAWAAMMSIGKDGYKERVCRIVMAAREIAAGVKEIAGLKLMTDLPFMVVCFGSDELDIYRILDVMGETDWGLVSLQSPASIHICVTLNVAPKAKDFLQDLRKAVDTVRAEGMGTRKKGTAGIYGMADSLPKGPVQHILNVFTDMTLTP